jgi:hypothetical protein
MTRGSLRLCRPSRLDSDTTRDLDVLAENEAVRRVLRHQGERELWFNEKRAELTAERMRTAGLMLHRLREVRETVQEAAAWEAAERRNVRKMFAAALDPLSRGDMINLSLLELQLRRMLARSSVAEMLATYRAALNRQDDPRSFLEVSIIEELSANAALSRRPEDLPVAHELREHKSGVELLRIPADWPDWSAIEHDCDVLESRARLLQVDPIDPERDPQAVALDEQAEQALVEAGEQPDSEDQAALRLVNQ